jgi:hypothetical protein
MVKKHSLVTSSQVITSPFTGISTNLKNLLRIIISGLLLFLTLGVNTSFGQCISPRPFIAQCGPGHHWIDNCSGGVDTMQSRASAQVNFDPASCAQVPNPFTLCGPVKVVRQASKDTVVTNGCASARVDSHKAIPTEIVSMVLTGVGSAYGFTLIAGQSAATELRKSSGAIVEFNGNDSLACSFFDVFFKLVTPMGTLYNHEPLRVQATIDRVPPAAVYQHIFDSLFCVGLYDSPTGGTKRANLVKAEHEPTPITVQTVASQALTRILNPFQGVYAENSKSASISWQIPFEWDNIFYLFERDDNFYIERSRDGVQFKKIGAVVRSGNANTTNYTFTDPYPLPLGYYRLQFISNGGLSYSQVITVVSVTGGKLIISPNPSSGKIKLLLNNMQLSAVDVTVYDSYGRLVLSRRIGEGGQPEINISGLSNGTYLVQCRHNGVIYQQKLVKK